MLDGNNEDKISSRSQRSDPAQKKRKEVVSDMENILEASSPIIKKIKEIEKSISDIEFRFDDNLLLDELFAMLEIIEISEEEKESVISFFKFVFFIKKSDYEIEVLYSRLSELNKSWIDELFEFGTFNDISRNNRSYAFKSYVRKQLGRLGIDNEIIQKEDYISFLELEPLDSETDPEFKEFLFKCMVNELIGNNDIINYAMSLLIYLGNDISRELKVCMHNESRKLNENESFGNPVMDSIYLKLLGSLSIKLKGLNRLRYEKRISEAISLAESLVLDIENRLTLNQDITEYEADSFEMKIKMLKDMIRKIVSTDE